MTRQRPRHPDIIYRPDLQPPGKRLLFSGITLLAWMIWGYLFLPLLSVAAWWFGVSTFREQMLDTGRGGYLLTLTGYVIVIVVTSLVIIGWSRYNQFRFSGPDRRRPVLPVTDEMVQERFNIEPDELLKARQARVIEIEFEESGRFRRARFRPGELPNDPASIGRRPATVDRAG